MINKKIIVAMSGGIDSSVTAYILKQLGYYVEGIFMKNWENDDNDEYCNAIEDFIDAKDISNKLNIKLNVVNFSKEYWNKVFIKSLDKYILGETPNPDILCNKEIKFKVLKEFIENNMNFDYISTGHYVRKHFIKKNNSNILLKSIDIEKDQSYFLYNIKSNDIYKYIFPLGNFKKNEVRRIAKNLKFKNFNKKDSTGICFVGKRPFKKFLSKFISIKKGEIITEDGYKLGIHDGIYFYTIGQRKGLNIGGVKKFNNKPWYIIDKIIQTNTLIVSQNKNHSNLLSNGLIANNINWINNININNFLAYVKIISDNSKKNILSNIILFNNNNYIKIIFSKPYGVVVPGQSVVLYINNVCLGGAIICSKF